MWILGISAYYHDSAAALIKDGVVVAAAQEERFNRKKHFAGFPAQSVEYCLREADITLEQVENIVFYEKPFLKFERLLETYHAYAPSGFRSFVTAMPIWLKEKLFQKRLLKQEFQALAPDVDVSDKLLFSEHHLSHAASAFYSSPFDKALILTMDGTGEWATTSVMMGEGREIELLKEIHFPHSLGLLYSAFTYYCGFKVNAGEYKLMGLAPYGQPKYVDQIREHLVDIADDGTFRLNMKYFNYCTGLTMTNKHFDRLFGRGPRQPESEVTKMDMDLAHSIQVVTEEIVLKMTRSLRQEYGVKNLCLAGGVALNCVANGKILSEGIFDGLWVQPSAGDAGGALGAALVGHHLYHQRPRVKYDDADGMQGGYLGPSFSDDEILETIKYSGLPFEKLNEDQLIDYAAKALADEKVIGWFQGRMEFGPRALGNRSILGDPRSPKTQSVMNLKIKFRESFRPFAPSVLRDDVNKYFKINTDSPYMLLVAPVQQKHWRELSDADKQVQGVDQVNVARSSIPAVTHVDYSARLQTVDGKTNPLYYKLISRFKTLTNVGLVVNTSFNVRGEPIVCTPDDALRCFQNTGMDELYLGSYRLIRPELLG